MLGMQGVLLQGINAAFAAGETVESVVVCLSASPFAYYILNTEHDTGRP